jgi:ankyrin repeat protein
MSINLTLAEIQQIQVKYFYLVNYESDDPNSPIDPMSYVDSNGDSLLHIATNAGDLSTVKLLLKAGFNVNKIGDMGSTALHYARTKRHVDIANILSEFGALTNLENDFGQLSG